MGFRVGDAPASPPRPFWIVWWPENKEGAADGHKVQASDAESAAEAWAEDYDADCFHIMNGKSTPRVFVKREGADDATAEVFVVSGEAVPTYQVSPVENPLSGYRGTGIAAKGEVA